MRRPDGRRPSAQGRGPVARPAARGRAYLVLCVLMAAVAVLLVGGFFASSSAPAAPPGALGTIPAATQGPADKAVSAPTVSTPAPASHGTKAAKKPARAVVPPPPFHLKASAPVSVRIPSAGIDSTLLKVGLNKDGTIEVPVSYSEAAWYRLGPTPGALGPAVIVGHVDSYQGPGVFFKLGALRPGQRIDVTRADKSVAHFRVDAINSYLKDKFPTKAVYGPINYAGLRLVTCGGQFDKKAKSYKSNVVVFASLIRP